MRGESNIVKQLLRKAKDSALLAIEFYNKPAVSFKSEGFITMMCIAWTSLFHAYFFKNKIKPYYRTSQNGKRPRFVKIKEKLPNGNIIEDYKWWELTECLKQYFKEKNDGVRKNLEFFSGLRNLIVHRNLPELDSSLFAECQANILNFNNFLINEFGEKHRIDFMLSFSLQMFQQPTNFIDASKDVLKKKNAEEIVEFIKSFRSSLTDEIFSSPEYSFKAVLIKVKNHESKDALALRFVNEKDLTEEQKEQLKNIGVVLIKEKEKKVDGVPDKYVLDYKALCNKLKEEIPSIKFNSHFHNTKREILSEHSDLVHQRKLDPNNPKSQKKDFYSHDIVKKFKERYGI
jgi:hypothetical protein